MNETQTQGDLSQRRVVVPGDVLDTTGELKPGSYTYVAQGNVVAARLGLLDESDGFLNIIPLSGVYNPASGDVVIGIVTSVGPSNWMVDINAPYPAPMHVSETPWDVEFGETAEYLRAGDAILCKILFVDETKKVQVTMKESSLRKLAGGQIFEVAPSKIARVIGKKGSMIDTIKEKTEVWLFAGQNGRIWINGELDDIALATDTVRLIEREAHRSGLTERVAAFLAERTKDRKPKKVESEVVG